jgi:hypothetical protein
MEPTVAVLNEWTTKIHQHNVDVGWWDNDPSVLEKIMLIITEIAEATEGVRKNLLDDHLSHRSMEEVELADALIRTLDLGGRMQLKLHEDAQKDIQFDDELIQGNSAERHLSLCTNVTGLADRVRYSHVEGGDLEPVEFAYSYLVFTIIEVARLQGHDIMAAMAEKFEYNKVRADHKRENRALENGKKF